MLYDIHMLLILHLKTETVQRNVDIFCSVLHCLSCTFPIRFVCVVLNNSDPIERSLQMQTIKKRYVTVELDQVKTSNLRIPVQHWFASMSRGLML